MKDPDNGNDTTNDESNDDADDMSLANLLGGDTGEEAEAPERVESRDDEPDSGMVNLAKMVADSSVETAKVPSIIPPPAAAPDPTGRTDTTGRVAATAPMSAAAPVAQEKKSSAPMYALIAVVLIAAGATIAYLATRDDEPKGDDEATLAMMAKLEQMEKDAAERAAKVEEERKAEQEKMKALEAKLAGMAAGAGGDAGELSAEEKAKMEALQQEIDEAKAKEEELAQEAAEAEKKADDAKKKASKASGKKGTKVAKADTKKDTKKKSGSDSIFKDTPKKKDTKKDTKKGSAKGGTPKKGADELDSLLGGNDKKKDDAKKEDKPTGPSLPKKLSKSQIKAGMASVQGRAQKMCAKYSTGVVQIQLIIGGNGRVKKATPKGAFGNSTAGKCVAMQARTAKFPKFSDSSQSVLYPISLK